ncbi:3-isopropylmalate dehydratase small subunit [Blochmannia endosymbiont of Polyrhachis (Hedomyrma) turneri]|uniref:3-isopropylmalate dehydratase small subunit n=1 Tax=Blochmannia endosymbiont of Polyrhachis (Hedomyrma) turneri TaxID=1505596 RepID=UPI00061A7C39|nr:3-isopropylmalate dehydratase small subunit [Blochmannia endosymbiont of Polyrhachis (Hedomyrma) turneri]AKC59713.1 3-isopropylmalate dehydratase small subunit [Blochmannia endosymbiont of Polyrhachis (Hedomyrma) turneri]
MNNNHTQHTGIVVPLDMVNVDTDAIISKQFLTKTTQHGFGKYLFSNWRFLDKTCKIINPHFILNQPHYKHASILLTRENFGCGSSREHAVWALADYGFHVIIAPSFADIFYNNCIQNKLLAICVSHTTINQMFKTIFKNQQKTTKFTIDLNKKIILINHTHYYTFAINDHHLNSILNNIDYIHTTLQYEDKITNYENSQPKFLK